MISITSKGNYSKTKDFLNRIAKGNIFSDLDSYGRLGVEALSRATPKDTGLASHSWGYRIVGTRSSPIIEWFNTDDEGGITVVILIQYGHGTGTGGYVQGRDFINPAMRPVFDRIAQDIGKKVNS